MTFDLEAAKRLAQQLAGDVLAQIEKDGSINRGNIAGQLLAGLVLEAAREGMKDRLFTQAANNQVGGLQSLIAEGPWPAAPSTGLGGDDRVVTNSQPIVAEIDDEMLAEIEKDMGPQSIVRAGGGGKSAFFVTDAAGLEAVHINCPCAECKRRRKLSLCGCEMCMHHSEAAAIIADKRSSVWKLWSMKNGERVPVEATPDNARYLKLALSKGAPVEVINGDAWFFPDGRVMTGLEVFQTGRTAAQIWASRPWPAGFKKPQDQKD